MSDLSETIRQNAAKPMKVSGDTGSAEQFPLKDQIEADRYLTGSTAASKPARGMRFTKMVPPGAT